MPDTKLVCAPIKLYCQIIGCNLDSELSDLFVPPTSTFDYGENQTIYGVLFIVRIHLGVF